jgi:hypothetical protein
LICVSMAFSPRDAHRYDALFLTFRTLPPHMDFANLDFDGTERQQLIRAQTIS